MIELWGKYVFQEAWHIKSNINGLSKKKEHNFDIYKYCTVAYEILWHLHQMYFMVCAKQS